MNRQAPKVTFDLEQIAAALFAQAGIKSGLWRLAAKLRFAGVTTASEPEPGKQPVPMPTGIVAVEGLAFFAADKPGDLVYDAAELMSRTDKRSTGVARTPPAKKTTRTGATRAAGKRK